MAEVQCQLPGGCKLTRFQEPTAFVFRYQHGDNPEHSLRVDAVRLDSLRDPTLEQMLTTWLDQVHDYESGKRGM